MDADELRERLLLEADERVVYGEYSTDPDARFKGFYVIELGPPPPQRQAELGE